MAYNHGVYASEVPSSLINTVEAASGLPVVFGSAPIHLVDDPSAVVNKPILANSYDEAVTALGFVGADANGDFQFTLCEMMKSHFALFNVAPLVLINVLDPANHSTSVTAESVTLVAGKATFANVGALRSTIVVKSSDEQTTYVLDTDYAITYNDAGKAIINRLEDGAIGATDTLSIAYDYLDPSQVGESDIVGGIDVGTGRPEGLELVNEIFPRFRLVPGQLLAPKYSSLPAVAAIMQAKASNINGHFKCMAVVDIPTDTVTGYTDAPSWKETNNVVNGFQIACWPKVRLGSENYHLSTQLASLTCLTDVSNDDIPYTSPSNKNLQVDSAVLLDGSEVWLGPESAAYLNGQGIVTALNFVGGWKAWGSRTAAYPSSTDPKDVQIPVRRMFNWVANTLILTFWQRLDFPLNRRQITTILDSANIWINGLVSQEYLLGGRVEFLSSENPDTDLQDSIARFHVYLTPPSPNREIDFILEYDATYLQSLFG